MKVIKVRIICLLLLAVGGSRSGLAQGCGGAMRPGYSIYDSESWDGTYIYTSILVDGSATCDPTSCSCNGQHTPGAYNQLGSSGYNSNFWGYGPSNGVTSYLSYQNNQSIAAKPGVDYPFTFAGLVNCSILGNAIWSTSFTGWKIRIAVASYQYSSVAGGICTYNLKCPNGNAAATCGSATFTRAAPCPSQWMIDDHLAVIKGTTKKCFNPGRASGQSFAVNCQ